MPPRAKRTPLPDDSIDDTAESGTLEGPVSQAEEPDTVRIAKRLGWKPQEEWEGSPEGWADPVKFLENTADQVKDLRTRNQELRERSERAARAAAEAIEDERRRTREESLRTIREASDPDERTRAAQRLAENAGPPPETRAWLAKNAWFETDPDAALLARGTVDRLAARGVAIAEQLEEAERVVRKRFPEHFEAAPRAEERGEVPLSQVSRAAPAVQQGTRAGAAPAKDKGFADIPAADRQAFRTSLLKHFMANGQTQAQAEDRYARSYWRTGVLPPGERGEEMWPMTPQTNAWAKRGGRAG